MFHSAHQLSSTHTLAPVVTLCHLLLGYDNSHPYSLRLFVVDSKQAHIKGGSKDAAYTESSLGGYVHEGIS